MSSRGKKKLLGFSALAWAIVAATVLLIVGANAHLLYVAFESQAKCVPHTKVKGAGSEFRAAKPSC